MGFIFYPLCYWILRVKPAGLNRTDAENRMSGGVGCLTGRRISREGGKAEGFDGRCRLDPRGCAALRAAQAADAYPPPRCRGREVSATTIKLIGGAKRSPVQRWDGLLPPLIGILDALSLFRPTISSAAGVSRSAGAPC